MMIAMCETETNKRRVKYTILVNVDGDEREEEIWDCNKEMRNDYIVKRFSGNETSQYGRGGQIIAKKENFGAKKDGLMIDERGALLAIMTGWKALKKPVRNNMVKIRRTQKTVVAP